MNAHSPFSSGPFGHSGGPGSPGPSDPPGRVGPPGPVGPPDPVGPPSPPAPSDPPGPSGPPEPPGPPKPPDFSGPFSAGPPPSSEHSGSRAFNVGPFSFGPFGPFGPFGGLGPFGHDHGDHGDHGGHGGRRHGPHRGESRRERRGGPYGWKGGADFGSADFWRTFAGAWGRAGWGPSFGPGRPPRARRGDIRSGILHLLADADRPMHGYEMIRELQERSGGAWRPSAGSIYPTLQLLEDEGLVESTEGNGKRLYALTQAGRDEIDSRGGHAPWEEFSEPTESPWTDIRNAGAGLMAAAMQGAHAANEDQLRRIADTLREARSRIYRILGEDEGRRDSGSDADSDRDG